MKYKCPICGLIAKGDWGDNSLLLGDCGHIFAGVPMKENKLLVKLKKFRKTKKGK